jgi:flavin-dependent dehydrogenase
MAVNITSFDAIVVGGGPAGSTCARVLGRGGLRVAIVERRRFPRVKLCGGWLSPPVWDELELSRREYTGGLWPWERCHVQFGGERHTVAARGDFIRRVEFDDFLVRRSAAELIEDHTVQAIEPGAGGWIVDGAYRARWLIGAGGTHCPVARQLFPAKPHRPVGAQERELQADAGDIAAARVGADGEPELLLHDDLGGYSWNVPKGAWLNVGTGTAAAKEVLSAWAAARTFFTESGHVPASARPALERMEGHSYHLFDPAHLQASHRDGAFLVGDALGLAHPLTAEGILPAIVSGRACAEAILSSEPSQYGERLASHPTVRDYALAHDLVRAGVALRWRLRLGTRGRSRPSWLSRQATARGFAWLFGGRPLPGGGILRALLRLL